MLNHNVNKRKVVICMIHRNRSASVRPLTDEERQQMQATLAVVSRKDVDVLRGTERNALAWVSSPASGRLSARATRLLIECATLRNLGTLYPQAVRLLKTGLTGLVLLEPVTAYDTAADDQYPIRWSNQYQTATINLVTILQPMGQEVPRGFVAEVPTSLQRFENGQCYVALHIGEALRRSKRTSPPEVAHQNETNPQSARSGT